MRTIINIIPRTANKLILFSLLVVLPLSFITCKGTKSFYLYKNENFSFAVMIPPGYQMKETPSGDVKEGIELKNEKGFINIRAMATGTDYEKMPFDEYVKISASVEIQNYEKLASIEPFVSDHGIKGYKTYWERIETSPDDEPAKKEDSQVNIDGPIYYFPPLREKKRFDHPVKTIMISFYATSGFEDKIATDAEKIAKSFKY